MKTILIIDDEEDLCAILARALKKENFSVECVHTLADAADKLKQHYDIILLDNNLPDGSGLDFFSKYTYMFKKSCVVLITADSRHDVKNRVEKLGIAAFIQKPFSSDTVKKIIRELA
jgi:two-component system response regulator (stage 0 sporulation protein F)